MRGSSRRPAGAREVPCPRARHCTLRPARVGLPAAVPATRRRKLGPKFDSRILNLNGRAARLAQVPALSIRSRLPSRLSGRPRPSRTQRNPEDDPPGKFRPGPGPFQVGGCPILLRAGALCDEHLEKSTVAQAATPSTDVASEVRSHLQQHLTVTLEISPLNHNKSPLVDTAGIIGDWLLDVLVLVVCDVGGLGDVTRWCDGLR